MNSTVEPRKITLLLDELDYAAVQAAMAKRQLFRADGKCILPDGTSNTAGALIAEVCRGWLEMVGA